MTTPLRSSISPAGSPMTNPGWRSTIRESPFVPGEPGPWLPRQAFGCQLGQRFVHLLVGRRGEVEGLGDQLGDLRRRQGSVAQLEDQVRGRVQVVHPVPLRLVDD